MAVAIVSCALASCSKTNPVSPNDIGLITPKAGSSYTFNSVSISGGTTVEKDGEMTVVMESGLSYGGRGNVVKMMTNFKDIDYFSYESNGDMDYLFHLTFSGTTVDSMWVTFPIGSRGSVASPAYDRVFNGQRMQSGGTITYLGAAQLTVPAGTFQTQMLEFRTTSGFGNAGEPPVEESRFVDTVWFAPAIGYHVKESGIQTRTTGGTSTNYYSMAMLQSYTLK